MNSNVVIQIFRDATLVNGTYSKVARELGVTSSHVREVALGRRTSERVMKAVCAEVARIKKLAARRRLA